MVQNVKLQLHSQPKPIASIIKSISSPLATREPRRLGLIPLAASKMSTSRKDIVSSPASEPRKRRPGLLADRSARRSCSQGSRACLAFSWGEPRLSGLTAVQPGLPPVSCCVPAGSLLLFFLGNPPRWRSSVARGARSLLASVRSASSGRSGLPLPPPAVATTWQAGSRLL